MVGKAVSKLDGSVPATRFPGKSLVPTFPFTKLPRRLFDDTWVPICAGRWRYSDHITLGEARAVVKLCELLVLCPGAFRAQGTSLQDNGAVSGSFTKGRFTAPSLNYLLRRRGAHALAAQLRLLLPWVVTPDMPADDLSRRV